MVGWHHLNGHGFEQTLGGGKGQGSLACCSPWGRRVGHDLETEQRQQINCAFKLAGKTRSNVDFSYSLEFHVRRTWRRGNTTPDLGPGPLLFPLSALSNSVKAPSVSSFLSTFLQMAS